VVKSEVKRGSARQRNVHVSIIALSITVISPNLVIPLY